MTIKKGAREELEIEIATEIANKINNLQVDHFDLGICGGTSVSGIFHQLLKQKVDWDKCRIFFVDDRLVPTTHPESNYKLAYDNFLHTLINEDAIKEENIYPFQFNPDVPDLGVSQYSHEFNSTKDHFDLILVSAGEDGHIASLFPNHPSIESNEESFIKVLQAPKAPSSRMSASPNLLRKSKSAILLFFGESKKKALDHFKNSSVSVKDCPAKLVQDLPEYKVYTDID